MTRQYLYRQATLPDGSRADVLTRGTRIAAIGPLGDAFTDTDIIDATGLVVSPSFVDAHIHLDKTLAGLPFIPHRAGNTVADRIAREKELREELAASVVQRGGELIRRACAFGTGRMRSHVDIDTLVGLRQLEEVVELRERFRHLVDIQIVAFPQSGILRDPGVADLLDEALENGADLVGGLDPAMIDGDAAGHLDIVFALAERHGVGIDIHLHEPGELGLDELREIARRTAEKGLEGRVAVSHAFALGERLDIGPTVEALARSGVAIVTNAPGAATMPPIRRLTEAGVLAVAGSDNIRDAWSPYGNGDMLERAMLVGYRQDFRSDEDIALAHAMATANAALAMGVADYGLREGASADLVFIEGGSLAEAVAGRGTRRLVVKNGAVVARDGTLTEGL